MVEKNVDEFELGEEAEEKNGDELKLLGQEEDDIVRPLVPVHDTNRD